MPFRLFVSLVSDRMMPPAHLPSLPLSLPSLQLHNTESVVHSASAAPTSLLPSRPGDAVIFFFKPWDWLVHRDLNHPPFFTGERGLLHDLSFYLPNALAHSLTHRSGDRCIAFTCFTVQHWLGSTHAWSRSGNSLLCHRCNSFTSPMDTFFSADKVTRETKMQIGMLLVERQQETSWVRYLSCH